MSQLVTRLLDALVIHLCYVSKVILLVCYICGPVEEPQNKAIWSRNKTQDSSNQMLSVLSKKHGPPTQVLLEMILFCNYINM